MKLDVGRLAGCVSVVLLAMLLVAAFVALADAAFGQGIVAGVVVIALILVAVAGTIGLLKV